MPFQSEKQRRYLWANEPEIARDWADTYGSRIEKNDGGIMRVKLATGMSPGLAQARGIGAQHHGSTTSWDKTRETERRDGPTAGHVPRIGYVAPQTQTQINANQRAQLLAERKDKKKKESIFKKLQRKAITWDLKKRLRKKTKLPTYDAEAAAYGIFDEDTETLQDQIDRANLPFDDPKSYTQKDYSTDYGLDTTNSGGDGAGYMGYPSYAAWLAAQNRNTGGVTEVAEVVEDVPSNFQGVTMDQLTYPNYPLQVAQGGRIPAAFGGIMDSSTGRKAYGFGSFFKSIGKAAKKVVKSPIGKAALMYGAYQYGPAFLSKGMPGGDVSPGNWGALKWFGDQRNVNLLKTIGIPTLLPFVPGMGPDDDDDDDEGFDYDTVKQQYKNELMRIKAGARDGTLDPNQWNYLGVHEYKDGGRIGYYKGGQSIPSDFTLEDAHISTTQDKLGGITDVMKQADLYRSGDVGQFYAADGGRIGYDAGGQTGRPPINLSKGNDQPVAPVPAPMSPNQNPMMNPGMVNRRTNPMMRGMNPMNRRRNPMMARGNPMMNRPMMNPMMGGRRMAQVGGLMDLGGMEKDYRQEGGFVPLGGEEKADDVPARLSKNEFVFTADAVRGAGGGDIDKGAEIMENVMENLENGGNISEESQGREGAKNMFATAQRLEGVI